RIGTKRLLVGAHYDTLDSLAQSKTALVVAVYTLSLIMGILITPELYFEGWRGLFTFTFLNLPLGQMLATLAFLALAWHAWIGVRDIWMDYVRSAALRVFLQVLTVLWLVVAIIYFPKILWSL